MQLRKLFYLMMILPILFLSQACSDDKSTDPAEVINEAEVLAKYIEENIGVANVQSMVTASTVYNKIITGATDQFVMDIRAAADYANGHIQGAVNVSLKDIVTYYETNNLSSYASVVIACYTGQTAGYATALLRMLGYNNVADLKWGMCSWNDQCANGWKNAIGNNFASQFVNAPTSKNAPGDLPKLSTGKKQAADILKIRIQELLASADPFGDAKVTAASVFANLTGYYIVNYWPQNHYELGHIPGAIQYANSPSDFAFSAALNTLPVDKPIAIYCYTGQTSAHMSAYLRVLGYDAKSLLFGVNTMYYDLLPANKFAVETEVHNYPLAP